MAVINKFDKKYAYADASFIRWIFLMHLLMSLTYYIYALSNPSDSAFYFKKVLIDYRGPEWMDFYGTSTTLIEWIGYLPLHPVYGVHL